MPYSLTDISAIMRIYALFLMTSFPGSWVIKTLGSGSALLTNSWSIDGCTVCDREATSSDLAKLFGKYISSQLYFVSNQLKRNCAKFQLTS